MHWVGHRECCFLPAPSEPAFCFSAEPPPDSCHPADQYGSTSSLWTEIVSQFENIYLLEWTQNRTVTIATKSKRTQFIQKLQCGTLWSFVVAGSILSYAFCLFKLNLGFFFWIFITLLSVAFNKCGWGSGVMFYSSYPFFFHSYTLFLNRLHSLCLNQCHMRFICQSPSFSRVQLCLRARASSVAPLWLIWLFRRSSCVSTLLEARPSQKSEKASSLIPNAFHSNTSLWTHDSTVYVYCNSKRH